MSENPLFVFVGDYESVDDAKADLEELHSEKFVGTYDAAVLTKNEEGKVEIVDKIEKPTQHGGWAGLAVGAAIGLIFAPSVLVSGLVGAGAGALIGHLRGGMSNSGLEEVGEMLEESEAALIVVGEMTVERAVEEAVKRTKKEMKNEVRADAREIERAIDSRSRNRATVGCGSTAPRLVNLDHKEHQPESWQAPATRITSQVKGYNRAA